MQLMKKMIVEFIGTFFLVFTVGMTALRTPGGVIAPLAIGSALMIMVYAGGYISGGHYNPAVTLAVLLRGKKISLKNALGYWVSQIAAAFVAASMVLYMKDKGGMPPSFEPKGPVFLAEFLFTFALAWVVLNTATAEGTKGNSFYGLAIGFTVMTGAFAVGPVSGGAFNPAVVTGAALIGLISVGYVWLYILANLTGAAVAAVIFRMVAESK
ncbi:MAG TPA: MIP/aquaporin family protein [Phycisphaerae bacterium]|nr:MIP/aquaporin family protein [Phycisphaerae bacterium]